MLSQRPLTASPADQALFIDRQAQLHQVATAVRLGTSALVVGPRGSGLTSFLHRVKATAFPEATYLDARQFDSGLGLVGALRALAGDRDLWGALTAESRAVYEEVDPLLELKLSHGLVRRRPPPQPRLEQHHVERLVDALAASGHSRVILLDAPAFEAARPLFAAYRDLLWEAPVVWVVAIEERDEHRLAAPPADAFFGVVARLGPLTQEDGVALLRARASCLPSPQDAERLGGLASRLAEGAATLQPRQLIQDALSALASEAPEDDIRAIGAAQSRAAKLGRMEAMVFEEVRVLGPVSAGDPELLTRLGVTRSRVVQALSRLEQEGLVRGRPAGRRKLYFADVPGAGGADADA